MIDAFELSGFFAAHAVWCICDGWPLKPILAYNCPEHGTKMERVESDGVGGTPIEIGLDMLAGNEFNAEQAAFLYDYRIAMGKERLDAIVIEIRDYAHPKAAAIMAVPYTPKAVGAFRVHKPKLLEWKNCDAFDKSRANQAFWKGAAGHWHGMLAWRAHLDESK